MPLVSMEGMLGAAQAGGYAVGAFNILDENSLRAVLQAAEELAAPVIVQTSVKTVEFWGAETIAGWVRARAARSPAPVALHLDHCTSPAFLQQCIDAGWTSVMIDASSMPFAENLAVTREVVAAARPAGVSVEAEMGRIAGVEEDLATDEAYLADPAEAEALCAGMGLAAFAPAVGTAHGLYTGEPKIAFDRLAEIAQRTGTPIALHGGTGLSDEVLRRCIALGCAKINISTALKHAFVDGFVEPFLSQRKYDPLKLLRAQFERLRDTVSAHIQLFGGAGRAAQG